jgi:drug/metabolite transporter (DMT)-like permease
MASHFGKNGFPNNWQTKEAFFLTMIGVLGISFVVSFVFPQLINRLPASMINLPHKEYWLAPERREETGRYMSAQMGWFGCALLFVLLYATSQVINANLPSPGYFDTQGMWAVLTGFLLFLGIWLVRFLKHFYRPIEGAASFKPR